MAKKRLITELDRFKLLYNTAYVDYRESQPVEIGKIIDTKSGQDIMYVYYNKNNYQENGYHINIDIYQDQAGEYPVANVDDMHRGCLYEYPDIFLALMLHEYGHYINCNFCEYRNWVIINFLLNSGFDDFIAQSQNLMALQIKPLLLHACSLHTSCD